MKVIDEKKQLDFWIEKGMEEGDTVVLTGEADQEPGMETGDAVFVVSEKPHPVFNRFGPDLKATLHITLAEALCGFSRVILTTLDGRALKYTSPATKGQVIRPNDILKIVGEGMPVGKKSDAKGNLYLDVEIEFPKDGWMTDPSQISQLRTLLPAQTSEPDKSPNAVPEIVDDVTWVKAEREEFGAGEQDWETDSDKESDGMPDQCATQ